MSCTSRNIEYASRRDTFKLYVLADIHLGSKYCDEKLLRATVGQIKKDSKALWIGLGDYAEFINRRDPRARESERATWLWGEDDLAMVQQEHLARMLAPIATKCVGLVKGNHEGAIERYCEHDVYQRLVESFIEPRLKADVRDKLKLGVNGFVRLSFRRQSNGGIWTCMIYATHGCTAGRKVGSLANRLGDIWGDVEADIVLAGHSHKAMRYPRCRKRATQNDEMVTRQSLLLSAGSLLGNDDVGWPEYAEGRDYSVTKASVQVITIVPDKQVIE